MHSEDTLISAFDRMLHLSALVESVRTPPIKESIVKEVEFPEEDESSGEIEIRFLGPDCTDSIQGKRSTLPAFEHTTYSYRRRTECGALIPRWFLRQP